MSRALPGIVMTILGQFLASLICFNSPSTALIRSLFGFSLRSDASCVSSACHFSSCTFDGIGVSPGCPTPGSFRSAKNAAKL